MFSKNEQEPIWGVAGGGEAQVWSTEGPRSPPGFFFSPLWLKTDKDICDPSGYQDSHGNSLVSYSVLVSTRNWEEGSMFQIKIALFPGVLVFWLGMTAFFFFWGHSASQLNSEGPVFRGGTLSPNLQVRSPERQGITVCFFEDQSGKKMLW